MNECEACGMNLAVDKHHPDGRVKLPGWFGDRVPVNPENVVLLCPVCHRLVHRGHSIYEVGQIVEEFWKAEIEKRIREDLLREINQDLQESGYYSLKQGPRTGKWRIFRGRQLDRLGEDRAKERG